MKIRNAARYQARNRRYRKPLWRLVGVHVHQPVRDPSKARRYRIKWDIAAYGDVTTASASGTASKLDWVVPAGADKLLADWLMNGFPPRTSEVKGAD